jgi:hypothetical protein
MARVLSIRNGVLPYPADASLIAAAPDLLAACKAMLDLVERHYPDDKRIDSAHAAILKAEGGAK